MTEQDPVSEKKKRKKKTQYSKLLLKNNLCRKQNTKYIFGALFKKSFKLIQLSIKWSCMLKVRLCRKH